MHEKSFYIRNYGLTLSVSEVRTRYQKPLNMNTGEALSFSFNDDKIYFHFILQKDLKVCFVLRLRSRTCRHKFILNTNITDLLWNFTWNNSQKMSSRYNLYSLIQEVKPP